MSLLKVSIHSFKVIDLMSLTIALPLFNVAFNIVLISGISKTDYLV